MRLDWDAKVRFIRQLSQIQHLMSREPFMSFSLSRTFGVVFLLAACITTPSHAQVGKVGISVTHSGEDAVGKQFSFAVREAVRASQGFNLVLPDDSGIQVRIVTIDPSDRSSGSSWTVATVVYTMANFITYKKSDPQTWYPIYLTSQVMTVGQQRLDEQAKSVLAAVDAALEKFRRDARE
jgi:hypothetical protein